MFRTTLTELAVLTVTGVNANYDVDAIPETVSRGQLPVLIVLPMETDTTRERRLFSERSQGFEAVAFSDGVRTVTYVVTHLLLAATVHSDVGQRQHIPALIDLIDNYFMALKSDVTLNDRLLEPTRVRVEPGIYHYGGVDYHGCAFRHVWVVQL